ncbi:MAG TPA: nuclease-related domain-containing protein [Atopostipes sp.]|nr:nuclease-related domain-containing protein [Atopostipes sp.]
MKTLRTKLQKEDTSPPKVIFETIKYNRGLVTEAKDLYELKRNIAGEEGEKIVLEYLEEFGRKDWRIIRNMWMNHYGPFECDLILITDFKVYVFEIKNYFGEFSYKNGITKIDGIQRNFNPIHQSSRNSTNIKQILIHKFPTLPVEGALIFTGINNKVSIESGIPDIEIIPRNHLMSYIRKVALEERTFNGPPINPADILVQLENLEIQNDFAPVPLTNDEMNKVKKGIYCAHCKKYTIKIKRFEIFCSCGYKESREQATLRTIKDYGILRFDHQLKIKDLLEFFNHQVSRNYLTKILSTHFEHVNNWSHSYYKNSVL